MLSDYLMNYLFAPELKVHLLPDQTRPIHVFTAFRFNSERLATLYQVLNGACDVLIAPVTTALYRLLPKEFLAAHTFLSNRAVH